MTMQFVVTSLPRQRPCHLPRDGSGLVYNLMMILSIIIVYNLFHRRIKISFSQKTFLQKFESLRNVSSLVS